MRLLPRAKKITRTNCEFMHRATRELLEPLAPGSHLMLSQVIMENPEIAQRVDAIYRTGGTSINGRTIDEITTFFQDLDICAPGVVPSIHWHPDNTMRILDEPTVGVGVARKK